MRRQHSLDHPSILTALLDALTCKADCIVLLDSSAAPIFVNEAAAQVLNADDGLRHVGRAFVTLQSSETRKLGEMIADTISSPKVPTGQPREHMLVTRPSGKRPYILRVTPPQRTARFLKQNSVACVIHIQDLAKMNVPSKASLCSIFGLTEREADFAIELVRCTGIDGAATKAGMAVNTARNHLQSIFRKTGTTNQAEAVQLFGRLL